MNSYVQMLAVLLEGVVVPRTALRCIFSNERTARYNILRGLRERHIKEIRFETVKHNNYQRIINALILTPEGLSYLYQNFFSFFHDSDKTLAPYLADTTPFGKEGMNARTKRTITEYGYLGVTLLAAGATMHFPLTDRHEDFTHFLNSDIVELMESEELYDDELFEDDVATGESVEYDDGVKPEDNKHSYRDLLRVIEKRKEKEGMGRDAGQNINEYSFTPDSAEYIEYVPRPTMKHAIQYIYKKGGIEYSARDYDRCQNRGVLQSHFRSVLLFTNLECGFRWIKKFTEVDITIYRQWQRALKKELRAEVISNKECGAVFVDNPRHFSQVYNDGPKVRLAKFYKNGSPRPDWFGIGDPFAHFYAVPTTVHGAAMLKRIMLNGDAKLKEEALERIFDLDFEPSNRAANELFPVVRIIDREADITIPYAICTDLDIMMIRKIDDYVEKREVVRGVLCEDWQVPYLEAAFKKNKEYIDIYPIDDSVIEGEPWRVVKEAAKPDAEEVPDDFIDFDNIDEDLLIGLRRSYEDLDDYSFEDDMKEDI